MKWFVQPDSIVRRIWGDADIVMLIFGAGAAEFALNRAVDWLFFTGAIPNDPLGRLFSTAAYAQEIVFAEERQAERTLARIRAIHGAVERKRGNVIPDWAHRDVLYMLIDYSERVFQTLYRPLTPAEQAELFDTFRRVGVGLGIPDLPESYEGWKHDRQRHIEQDLVYSPHTAALYAAYRRDLGLARYILLRQIQALLVPKHVHQLLNLPRLTWLRPTTWVYPALIQLGFRSLIHRMLIPPQYIEAVQRLHDPAPVFYMPHN
jgi:uncharacterized protein (DUF2236 family)